MLASVQLAEWTVCLALAVMLIGTAQLHAQDLPEGCVDHGIAAPVGMSAWGGTVATEDGDGNRLVFIKLWAGGGSSYLFIDAQTGETEQISPGIGGLGAYSVILAPDIEVYDTMGRWLLEIDVPNREVRRIGEIPGGMSLAWTIDPEGVVYAGIYPSATVVTYNPLTGEYTDHGALNEEGWPQSLRPLAVDAEGWVYAGIGQTAAQVVGLNPATGERRAYIPAESRQRGQGNVWLGVDGKVYANAPGWTWHALSGGEITALEADEQPAARAPDSPLPRPANVLPDGSRYTNVDVHNRTMSILDAGAEDARQVRFDYDSPGVGIYSMVAGPDGKVYGATGLPLRIWRFDPETGEMDDWGLGNHGGHVNQLVRQGDRLYGAVYSSGSLIELDPSEPVHDAPIGRSTNPRELHGPPEARDLYGRPHAMLAHPDGAHVIIGGNAARVLAGGGLLIYNVQTGENVILPREQLVEDQGVHALAALPDGDLIVGTTISAATGGTATAREAMLYRLNWGTREVVGRWTLQPAPQVIHDLVVAGDGLVYGLATGNRFFVFDPERGEFIHDEQVTAYGSLTGSQAPRTMALGPDGAIYALFRDAIARIEPGGFEHREVLRPGVAITTGIAIQGNRLYFASGPRLYSYDLGTVQ